MPVKLSLSYMSVSLWRKRKCWSIRGTMRYRSHMYCLLSGRQLYSPYIHSHKRSQTYSPGLSYSIYGLPWAIPEVLRPHLQQKGGVSRWDMMIGRLFLIYFSCPFLPLSSTLFLLGFLCVGDAIPAARILFGGYYGVIMVGSGGRVQTWGTLHICTCYY